VLQTCTQQLVTVNEVRRWLCSTGALEKSPSPADVGVSPASCAPGCEDRGLLPEPDQLNRVPRRLPERNGLPLPTILTLPSRFTGGWIDAHIPLSPRLRGDADMHVAKLELEMYCHCIFDVEPSAPGFHGDRHA